MTNYNCPACGSLQEVPANLVGIAVNCSSCGNTFLPAAEGPGVINPARARNSSSIRRKSGSRHKRNPGPLLVIALAFVVMTVIVVLVIGSSGKGNRGIVNGRPGKSPQEVLPIIPNLIKCPDCGGKVSKRAFACPHCGARFSMSKKSNAKIQLDRISQQLEHYRLGMNNYPPTELGLDSIGTFRVDPWGNPYQYVLETDPVSGKKGYKIWSNGPSGQPNGDPPDGDDLSVYSYK